MGFLSKSSKAIFQAFTYIIRHLVKYFTLILFVLYKVSRLFSKNEELKAKDPKIIEGQYLLFNFDKERLN